MKLQANPARPSPVDLEAAAQEGYNADLGGLKAHDACPHFLITPIGIAWLVGALLKRTGRSAPHDVQMERNFTLRVNDMLFDAHDVTDIVRVE